MKQGKVSLIQAETVANQLVGRLSSVCQRILVAGSIRRRRPEVSDIELLCIPKFVDGVDQLEHELGYLLAHGTLTFRLNTRGSKVYGPKNKLMLHVASGIGVDIFSTSEECWWVSLVVRTGGETTNKRIAWAAIKKGWHLQAYGHGFTTPGGDVVCRSEEQVFRAVGLSYRPPWERD